MIDRALRDRATALQSGPNDVGLFGATPHTFDSWSSAASGSFAVGAIALDGWFAHSALAHSDAGSGAAFVADSAALSGTIATPNSALTTQIETTHYAGRTSNGSEARPDAPIETAQMAGSGMSVTIQTSHSDGGSQSSQSTSLTTGGAIGHQGPVDPAIPTDTLGAIEAGIAQARAGALDQIEQIASSATAQIAALQTQIADTISATGNQVAGLGNAIGDALLQASAPVLDMVSSLPDTIGTTISADVDAALNTGLQIGDTQIQLAQQIAITSELALEAGLPIDGDDVAGGITTLVDLVTSEGGYLVEDVTAGIAWPLAANPLDTLAGLSDLEPAIEPGSALLGIAEPGDLLLGGLPDHDDFGLGLG
jgi:hypothetical protein